MLSRRPRGDGGRLARLLRTLSRREHLSRTRPARIESLPARPGSKITRLWRRPYFCPDAPRRKQAGSVRVVASLDRVRTTTARSAKWVCAGPPVRDAADARGGG